MIEIKAKGPGLLQGLINHLQIKFPVDRKVIWIGRGEELTQKQAKDSDSYALNLTGLSQTVSRIHASIILSPSFFYPQQLFPSFLTAIPICSELPNHILASIWQFLQSPRKILLNDNNSKTGLFKKVENCTIKTGLQVVLGDSRPLFFQNQEIYDSQQQLTDRIKELETEKYVIMNPGEGALSFWIVSFKVIRLVLLNRPGRILIGRSSECHLSISESCISRKHAHLDYINNTWRLGDGDGTTLSSNGVWTRTKKMWIQHRKKDLNVSQGEKVAKVGDVLLNFDIKQDYSFLGVQDSLEIKKNCEDSFDRFLKKQLQQSLQALSSNNCLPSQ